jgi:hypothetical protein
MPNLYFTCELIWIILSHQQGLGRSNGWVTALFFAGCVVLLGVDTSSPGAITQKLLPLKGRTTYLNWSTPSLTLLRANISSTAPSVLSDQMYSGSQQIQM